MIVAGHETTAVALFWSLYLLASAPTIQERLAAEVAGADLGPNNAAAVLSTLVYTRAVVHEALRLYPPAFTLARQALRADVAGGILVPAGTVVLIAPWVLHRHRRLWPQPEIFDPSRFLPTAPLPDRFAYLPLGVGPRVCIGAQFALTEATLVLATMIQTFHVERADDIPVTRAPSSPPNPTTHRDSACGRAESDRRCSAWSSIKTGLGKGTARASRPQPSNSRKHLDFIIRALSWSGRMGGRAV
jgi:cytochrome P450